MDTKFSPSPVVEVSVGLVPFDTLASTMTRTLADGVWTE